jgi:hexulose-6-phosphate isomerase
VSVRDGGLDRRELLLGASALALGAAAGCATPAAATGTPRRGIRKAVKLGMVQEGATLREKMQLLVDLGFDGVELSSPNELDLDEVLAARDATGLEIHGVVDSVHWTSPLSHADLEVRRAGREGLETALSDAHAYGASTVLLVPAVVNRETPYDVAWERSTAEIRACLPLARELSVAVAFENVWNGFLLSPLEARDYVDQFDDPRHVGWYFDVGNVVNLGWPEQWVRILGPRVMKLDVKEFSRERRDAEGLWKGFDVELGEGDCGWPDVRAALDEVGFSGWATAEVRGGDRERLADLARRMDRVLGLAQPPPTGSGSA